MEILHLCNLSTPARIKTCNPLRLFSSLPLTTLPLVLPMNHRTIKVAAVAAVVAIGSGCANMTPTENAVVAGTLGGIAAGAIGSAAGLSAGDAALVGLAAGAVVGATVYVIAKHQ